MPEFEVDVEITKRLTITVDADDWRDAEETAKSMLLDEIHLVDCLVYSTTKIPNQDDEGDR